jgi:hypothetical protein
MKITKNICVLFLLIFISSCSGYEYVSSPHYVPLHKEKGELTSCVGHNNIQMGYSLTNHFAVFASGKYRNTRDNIKHMFGESEGSYSEKNDYEDETFDVNIGAGVFNHYHIFTFETLVGTGLGQSDYEHTKDLVNMYSFNLQANRLNFHIQQNFGVNIWKNYLEMGISAKYINFLCYDINNQITVGDNRDNISTDTYFVGKKTARMSFFEPGLTIRGGFHHFKVQTQLIPVINLTENRIRYRELSLFVSFSVNLNLLKLKKD